jgi:hypothetical protein
MLVGGLAFWIDKLEAGMLCIVLIFLSGLLSTDSYPSDTIVHPSRSNPFVQPSNNLPNRFAQHKTVTSHSFVHSPPST